jgi:hypothetical protein
MIDDDLVTLPRSWLKASISLSQTKMPSVFAGKNLSHESAGRIQLTDLIELIKKW